MELDKIINSSRNNYLSKTYAIVDSGASDNYIPQDSPHQNTTTAKHISITQPNGKKLTSTTQYDLRIKCDIPQEAKTARIIKVIRLPLISVSKLCNHNCTCIFTKNNLTIYHKKKKSLNLIDATPQIYGQSQLMI